MDYFNNVLTTFLRFESFSCFTVYGSESSKISSNVLICVMKMNEGFGTLRVSNY